MWPLLSFLIESFVFVISVSFNAFATGNIVLPLFYGMPKAFIGFVRKKLRFKAVIMYLIAPTIWIVGLIILSVMVAAFLPSLFEYLQYSPGFYFGSLIGFWGVILKSIFSKQSRADNRSDYAKFVERYRVEA